MNLNQKCFRQVFCFFVLILFSNRVLSQPTEVCVDIQTGKASFYANKFNGRKTASGEIFYGKNYTCAHRFLPFGTILKVTNLLNNRFVVVRVNDRGPFVKGRIIDLSLRAAKDINMIGAGTANVKIEIIDSKNIEIETVQYQCQNYCQIDKYSFED